MALRPGAKRTALAAILIACAGLAWFVRDLEGLRHRYRADSSADWFSRDPDGLYHARRVRRALDQPGAGWLVEGTDPYLDPPHGAPIPWPPYYDSLLALGLGPLTPRAEPERSLFVERATGMLPVGLGVATVVCAALAAAVLAGPSVAGVWGAINYSFAGSGDHHAWIAFLHALALLVSTWALARGALQRPRAGLLLGLALGALFGLMLGSWVASLLLLGYAQLWLVFGLWLAGRRELGGARGMGLGVHAGALLVLLPAILASPWKDEFPWMVVNLTWFHAMYLALGAVFFALPVLLARGAMAAGTRVARFYVPAAAAVALVLIAATWAVPGGPVQGVRAGLEWVSRADRFMGTVRESAPLLGPQGDLRSLLLAAGAGVFLLPVAWVLALRRARASFSPALWPWLACAPPMLAQALVQRRFSDVLAVPLAVLVGAEIARRLRGSWRWTIPVTFLLALAFNFVSLREVYHKRARTQMFNIGTPLDHYVGERRALEWMRPRAEDEHALAVPRSVLAHWDRGHAIEWAADRPSVANNFGSYISLESYTDPSRFFLEEDPLRAEALLERRNVRFVFVPGDLPAIVPSMCNALGGEQTARWLTSTPQAGVQTSTAWLRTLGARLLHQGEVLGPPEQQAWGQLRPLDCLRLVHVSAYLQQRHIDPRTRAPRPAVQVWERVAGARVELRGNVGESTRVWVEVRFPNTPLVVNWSASAQVGESGVARLRVPYATEIGTAQNDAVGAQARYQIGERTETFAIPEASVRAGSTISLP
jgi:hypothetical protein